MASYFCFKTSCHPECAYPDHGEHHAKELLDGVLVDASSYTEAVERFCEQAWQGLGSGDDEMEVCVYKDDPDDVRFFTVDVEVYPTFSATETPASMRRRQKREA